MSEDDDDPTIQIDGPVLCFTQSNTARNNLEATMKDGGISITVEEPWAGSTETGFGYHCTVRMTKDEAVLFAEWILLQIAAGS